MKWENIMDLQNISTTVQSIAEAIQSVLNVDVTIIDRQLNRVAATGLYIDRIGNTVGKGTAMGYALSNQEKIYIDNPRYHQACCKCEKKDNCFELAEVCCPIDVAGEIYGVIGLIAFDENQQKSILANQDNLMKFLSKMGELIATKLMEAKKTEELAVIARELQVIIDSIEGGIISLDRDLNIEHYNSNIIKLLGLEKCRGMETYDQIEKFLNYIGIYQLLNNKEQVKNRRFIYKDEKVSGFFSITCIMSDNNIVGWVLIFNRMKEVLNVINEVIGNFSDVNFDNIEGKSVEINKIKALAMRASLSSSTVLIQGESGTGKEIFAKAIHKNSPRYDKPFIPINCAAIPEQLLESELFGYDEGAFTGAKKGGRIGKFEMANHGTIFLDEIGDMPIHLQTKLLRVLQDDYVIRIGGKDKIPIDVRIIAASNKDLKSLVGEGKFRNDLYYRINVIPLHIPPLRMRKEDIQLLAKRFLDEFNEKLNKYILRFDDKVIGLMNAYKWPGNVRELANVVEYSVNMANGSIILVDDLPNSIKGNVGVEAINNVGDIIIPIKELERNEIERAIEKYGRSKEDLIKASEALGIGIATMYRKLKLYDL